MKTIRKIIIAASLLFFGHGFAQVGINTTTPNAQLEIKSSNQTTPANTDGLLIPKVDAFPAANPGAAQQSMLVYLTTSVAGKTPGFYYWDNATTSWTGIAGTKGWDVVGNAGTTPATNFLGTTDNQGLAVRTNNVERMRIDNAGLTGIGTSTPKNKLHVVGTSTGVTPNVNATAVFENNPFSYVNILANSESGLIFGTGSDATSGAITYNNPGLLNGMSFRTGGNFTRMNLADNGNLALGPFVPQFPLHFQSTNGDKISLWGGAGAHTGFGVQLNLLQVYTGYASDDIAFGYGQSSAFTETMRIKNSGRVGIGTSAPDAKFQISPSNAATPANTDGIIIPRVNSLTAAASMTSAQNGMMVYLTNAFLGKAPGFYYWDNASTSWKGVGSGANWSLTGNGGTDSSVNFIGTTDNEDVMFRRNNVKAGRIGLTNTAFGAEASNANVGGFDNVAIGASALKVNTSGNANVAVGTNALLSNTASEIVGVGENALAANTTGLYNTAVGTNAARTNGTGICVTSMGYNSLYNSTASYNTAYGVNALSTNQTGEWNTAFGVDALRASTIGHHNTAIGDRAMIATTSGEQNTAIGHSSLANNLTGTHNVTIGMNSLFTNQAGISNTALGTGAMFWHASGSNNTALGMEAMNNQTSGSNNIAIGKGANVPSLTGSDQLSIGNVIYGTAMNAATSAKIGIGTTAPQTKLHIYNGASGMTPNPFSSATLEDSQSTYLSVLSAAESGIIFGANGVSTNGAIVYNNPGLPDGIIFRTNGNQTRMTISSAGNVGIGNYVPNHPLDFGVTLGDKINLWGGGGDHYGFGVQGNLLQIHADISNSDIAFGYGRSAAMTELMRLKGNGRLGLGTNAPDAKMEIEASNAAAPANTDGILIPRVNAFPVTNPTAAQNGMMIYLTTQVGVYQTGFYYWDNAAVSWLPVGGKTNWNTFGNAGTSPATSFVGTTDNAAAAFRTNNTERMRIAATGEVGIGTSAPSAELEVNGFTKLGGSSAPAIKVIKLTGTTASAMGSSVTIPAGVSGFKILEVSAMVEYTSGAYVPQSYMANTGYEFYYYISGSSIIVINKAGNSASILSKPIKLMVTYEE